MTGKPEQTLDRRLDSGSGSKMPCSVTIRYTVARFGSKFSAETAQIDEAFRQKTATPIYIAQKHRICVPLHMLKLPSQVQKSQQSISLSTRLRCF